MGKALAKLFYSCTINPFPSAVDLNAHAPRARDRPVAPQGAPVVAR